MVIDRKALCYGRDALIRRMLDVAGDRRCVLLFGGRQAGKTTVLQHAEGYTVQRLQRPDAGGEETAAVYVDLMALPHDAGPSEFYACLVERAGAVCTEAFDDVRSSGFDAKVQVRDVQTTDRFVEHLERLFRATRRVRRIVFLLDEAGRVLGRRFPRAFQDNLFSMLYVNRAEAARRVALVFSGAQELAGFCEDETSPLGSRAEQVDLVNLEFGTFSEFVRERLPAANEPAQRYLFEETGGHAGLAARLIRHCADFGAVGAISMQEASRELAAGSRRLFEHWMLRFSEDARLTLQRISRHQVGLRRREVAQVLEEGGRDRFGADRPWHELQYVGVCRVNEEGLLTRCNDLFWRYYREFEPGNMAGTADERRVWDLIKETETLLRKLVYRNYREKWPGRDAAMMRKVLGNEWEKVEEVRRRASAAYPLSPGHERELMDCMYLGQLCKLMVSNQAWELFRDAFGNKRELERKLEAIYPVRNDIAHFAAVPPKELKRCEVECDDILVMVRSLVVEEGQ